MKESLVVRVSTSRFFTWLIKHIASHVDPVLFKATNGRWTFFGPTAFPMLTITMTGRKSGKTRTAQLATIEDNGEQLIVASAMGQEKHPGWRYNLEANPNVEVQLKGESYKAVATALSAEEKEKVWPKILQSIPQIRVYETRTTRNIRVFRLRRNKTIEI